ncbi:hypothetical protein EYF80_054297 [Liparis tanakae]|uniref:Uncharacterized protein n=1 Tax=Liparis tanakae TaxID=230148 RepID=A0A4Z2F3S4_9TELE|nr:hypothetical protein EYF80_054297 [Liparis tanakae]
MLGYELGYMLDYELDYELGYMLGYMLDYELGYMLGYMLDYELGYMLGFEYMRMNSLPQKSVGGPNGFHEPDVIIASSLSLQTDTVLSSGSCKHDSLHRVRMCPTA